MSGIAASVRQRFLPVFAAGLLACLAVGNAQAQTPVPLRAGDHDSYARLVFDWPELPGFSIDNRGTQLAVRFDRPLRVDPGAAVARLPEFLLGAQVGADGRSVTFDLRAPMGANGFAIGNSVVVDLRPAGAPQSDAQAAQGASSPPTFVPVRVGLHDGFTRLVFEWPVTPAYQAAQQDGRAVVNFSGRGVIDSRALVGKLPPALRDPASRVAAGETEFSLAIPSDARLRTFTANRNIVLDVITDQAAALAAASAAGNTAAASSGSPTPTPPQPASTPQPAPTPATTAPGAGGGSAPAAASPQPVLPARPAASGQGAASAEVAEDVEENEFGEDLSEFNAEDQAEIDQIAAEEAALAAARASGLLEIRTADETKHQAGAVLIRLRFEWTDPIGAAVLRRGQDVWAVFDRREPLDLAPLRAQGSPYITRLEQLPVPNATVLRMRVPDLSINPVAKREGFDWVIAFRQSPSKPLDQIVMEADVDPDLGPYLLFLTNSPGRIFSFPDTDVGDQLLVATLGESGTGMDGARHYPEFDLPVTAQGLVVIPKSPEVKLSSQENGFVLSGPEPGLFISGIAPETPVTSANLLDKRRLFNFTKWKRADDEDDTYISALNRVLREATTAPEEEREQARLDVARFYLARGYGPEALGVLNVMTTDDRALQDDPRIKALKAAANLLTGRVEEARREWNDSIFDSYAEAALWRAAVLATAGQHKQAQLLFKSGESQLRNYPQPLKGMLAILRIETALANRDLRTADSVINDLDKDKHVLDRHILGDMRYHQARVKAARTDFDQATEIWEELRTGPDRKNAARAEQALINLGLKQDQISREEAIDRLNKLRYLWRGDRFELMVMRRLGELYLAGNEYLKGLGVYREAVSFFPDDPVAADIAGQMSGIFRDLFLEGGADALPPLRALAIYDEFRELTPTGPDGDRLVENLVDRLAAVDLLGRASRLLEHQIEYRLKAEERARAGAKLALIYLLDQKPLKAVDTLNRTEFINLPEQIAKDRSRIRAKANFEMGDPDETIKLLAGDIEPEADLLRRDVYWRQENWQEVAKVLQRLADNPPPEPEMGIPDDRARHVLNWAVALFFDNDEAGLSQLRQIYGPAMRYSSLGDIFDFIVTPGTSIDDLETVIREADRTESFNAFLENYRNRLLQPASAPAPAPAAEAEAPKA